MKQWLAWFLFSVLSVASAQGRTIPVVLVGPSQLQGAAVDMNPSGLLLGGWKGSKWSPDTGVNAPWPARWQAFTLGQRGRPTSLAVPQRDQNGPCTETLFTSMKQSLKASRSGEFHVLVPAGVKAQPRPVVMLPKTSSLYRGVVKKELEKLGFRNPLVNINAIVRVDLDGNGTQEVLIEASNIGLERFYPDGPSGKGQQYSVVLLRSLKNGEVFTSVLAKDIQLNDVSQAQMDTQGGRVMTRFGIAGVLDVNGDRRMEVVLAAAYYEGLSASLLEFTPSWKANVVAESGCGA